MSEEIYEITKDADGVDCYIKRGELVRCKDCDRGFGSPVCPIQRQGWAINTDTFYCEWGERREP